MAFARNGLGLPDVFGAHIASISDYTGPNPYVVGGVPVPVATLLGAGRRAHYIQGTITTDGLYEVSFVPSGKGPCLTWKAVWIVVATGIPAGAIDLSASTCKVFALGE